MFVGECRDAVCLQGRFVSARLAVRAVDVLLYVRNSNKQRGTVQCALQIDSTMTTNT